MRNPPAHRYIRLRGVAGVTLGQIVAEVVNSLALPGIPAATAIQQIHLLIGDVPGFTGSSSVRPGDHVRGGFLRVVVDNTKPKSRGRPKKEKPNPVFWLDEDLGQPATVEDYRVRHGLDPYLAKAGNRRIKAACRLWLDHVSREIVCGALLCGKTPQTIVGLLRKVCPKVAKDKLEPIRPVDVQSFHELFWDFTGWSQAEILGFLERNVSCVYSHAAATRGLDAMLFRMGVGNMALDRAQMLRDVQSIAYLEIDKYRHVGVSSAAEFQRLYGVMVDAFEKEDKYAVESEEILEGDEFDSALEAFDAKEIPRYSEILDNITQANDLESVAKAEELGLITTHHAEVMREQIIREQPMSGEDLDVLQAVRSMQYADDFDESRLHSPTSGLGEPDDPSRGATAEDEDFFDFLSKESGA